MSSDTAAWKILMTFPGAMRNTWALFPWPMKIQSSLLSYITIDEFSFRPWADQVYSAFDHLPTVILMLAAAILIVELLQ